MYQTDLNKIADKPLTDKCIVLDLDETLVHSHAEGNIDLLNELKIFAEPKYYNLREKIYKISMEDVVHKKGEGSKIEMWGVIRPHLREFLIACFNYFKIVVVWSAGRKNYVHKIVDEIFKDIKRPHFILTYDDLEKLHDNTFIKPLNKLIKSVPGLDRYMSLENTFIIDDRLSVFQEPNPHNGIQISAYKPTFNINESSFKYEDTALIQLKNWFLKPEVINCKDIRKLDKTKIFE